MKNKNNKHRAAANRTSVHTIDHQGLGRVQGGGDRFWVFQGSLSDVEAIASTTESEWKYVPIRR